MNDYADTLRRHRRLVILRTLAGIPGYAANESIVEDALDRWRVMSTRDQVRTELVWLADQGFVTNEAIGDFMMATITQAGLDVSQGKRLHPDIEKPAPPKKA
jgi:hypothetical protein